MREILRYSITKFQYYCIKHQQFFNTLYYATTDGVKNLYSLVFLNFDLNIYNLNYLQHYINNQRAKPIEAKDPL